ncbi:MAG: deoxyribonuclease IV [Thermodesulfobacteriota bacterium]
MPLGVHCSIAGGIPKAVDRAAALGCDCVQIFLRSPRVWSSRPVTKKEVELFRAKRKAAGLRSVAVHGSYLINLSSPKRGLFKKSVGLFIKEIELAGKLGADYVVTHPGSAPGREKGFGVKRVIEALGEVAAALKPEVTVLVENTAGAGSQTGRELSAIGGIIAGAKGVRAGLCFDTCHGFAAGYPMRNRREVDSLMKAIDNDVGIENLKLIHLNDSKAELGSGVDRHQHIGDGMIGLEGFRAFLGHRAVSGVPVILETPKITASDDPCNLKVVRDMMKTRA